MFFFPYTVWAHNNFLLLYCVCVNECKTYYSRVQVIARPDRKIGIVFSIIIVIIFYFFCELYEYINFVNPFYRIIFWRSS